MDPGYLWRAFVRVGLSLLCAGVFYSGWMAAFLLTARLDSSIVQAIGWLTAPVVTAAGFAAGIAVSEHLAKRSKTKFIRILVWPLVGCAVGAAAVYWFGPMLIVFGMFATGTASVILREAVLGVGRGKAN
jgi:hypothetical protein